MHDAGDDEEEEDQRHDRLHQRRREGGDLALGGAPGRVPGQHDQDQDQGAQGHGPEASEEPLAVGVGELLHLRHLFGVAVDPLAGIDSRLDHAVGDVPADDDHQDR